jgi:hypothetical protein
VRTVELAFAASDRAKKIEFQAKSHLLTTELFAWLALPGGTLLLLGAALTLPRRPRGTSAAGSGSRTGFAPTGSASATAGTANGGAAKSGPVNPASTAAASTRSSAAASSSPTGTIRTVSTPPLR